MKYAQEYVEKMFEIHNLILKDVYINNKIKMNCYDVDGYKYFKTLSDIINNKTPLKFHPKNPYTMGNIFLHFKINNINLQIISCVYKNSYDDMDWICECGNHFKCSLNRILNGKHYCNFCSKSKRFDGLRNYTGEIITHCKETNYTLLTPYIHRCNDEFEYICNKHNYCGIKKSTYDRMISCKRGCWECGVESRGIKLRKGEDEKFRELVKSKGFIYIGYDYDNQDEKSKRANINFMCPNHMDKGIQKIKYSNLLISNGRCKYCVGRERTKEDLQNELDKMHGLVEIIEYSDYSSSIKSKCRICNHVWDTNGVNLTQGRKCPNCTKSNFELEVKKLLDLWNLSHIDQYWYNDCRNINPLPFDFYLDDYIILIEADGEGHYIPIRRGSMSQEDAENQLLRTQMHDKIKTEYCKNNNIPLIRIPYWERNNLEDFLYDELIKYKIKVD